MEAVADFANDVPEYLCRIAHIMQLSGLVQTT